MNRMTEETSIPIQKRLDYLLGTGHPINSIPTLLEQEFPNHKLLVKGVVESYKEEHKVPKTPKFVEIADDKEDRRKRIDKRTTELIEKGLPYKEVISTLVNEFYDGTDALIRGSLYRYFDKRVFSDDKNK